MSRLLTSGTVSWGLMWGSVFVALLSKAICSERQLRIERTDRVRERAMWEQRVATAQDSLEAERQAHAKQRELFFYGGKACGAAGGFDEDHAGS